MLSRNYAGGNYLIFVQFDNIFIVPVKIKGVSIESNKPDLPVEKKLWSGGFGLIIIHY